MLLPADHTQPTRHERSGIVTDANGEGVTLCLKVDTQLDMTKVRIALIASGIVVAGAVPAIAGADDMSAPTPPAASTPVPEGVDLAAAAAQEQMEPYVEQVEEIGKRHQGLAVTAVDHDTMTVTVRWKGQAPPDTHLASADHDGVTVKVLPAKYSQAEINVAAAARSTPSAMLPTPPAATATSRARRRRPPSQHGRCRRRVGGSRRPSETLAGDTRAGRHAHHCPRGHSDCGSPRSGRLADFTERRPNFIIYLISA